MYTKLNYFDFFSVQFFSENCPDKSKAQKLFFKNVQKIWELLQQIAMLANLSDTAPYL